MRSVIVCISGASRTGKDTLIKHARERLYDIGRSGERRYAERVEYCSVSSIDDVKEFGDEMAAKLGIPAPTKSADPTRQQRQGWADIKRGLDSLLGYSLQLPHALLAKEPGKRQIMFYQVREVENIRGLRILAKGEGWSIEPGSKIEHLDEAHGGPAVIWVHVLRPSRHPATPAASNELYKGLAMDEPDIIVTNTGLGSLPAWGCIVADLAYQRMRETISVNLQPSAKTVVGATLSDE